MVDAPRLTPAKQPVRSARAERLARALRENLRRRKEQGRARELRAAELDPARPPADEAASDEPPA